MVDLVTIGWLTTDDIVHEDGSTCMGEPGGGALYSAIGAHVWSASVGIHAAAGQPHHAATLDAVARRGIDADGIGLARGNGIEFWLLHESEKHKQQVAKRASQPPLELDADRGPLPPSYAAALGYHIAPQGPESGMSIARALSGGSAIVTMDVLSDAILDASLYKDLSWTQYVDAFLPSEAEIDDIWAPPDPVAWLSDVARQGTCHMVGKFGISGSVVAEACTGRLIKVPALKVDAVDTTGAGDAFCGGFLAGLASGRDLAVSAAMGTVSASYVVEASAALSTVLPASSDRDDRLQKVLMGIGGACKVFPRNSGREVM